MAEAEQPQIDDLKRLLKRLEQAAPEGGEASKAPQPPPLPRIVQPETKPSLNSAAKELASQPARVLPAAAPEALPQAMSGRPKLTWLVAGAGTAAVAVAAIAMLQTGHVAPPKAPESAARHESKVSEKVPRPATIETAATSTTPRTTATAPAKIEPPPTAAPTPPAPAAAPAPSAPVPAETVAPAPKAATPATPAAAADSAPPASKVTTPTPAAPAAASTEAAAPASGPIPESPTLRAAGPSTGRDKYESEARLDAYLERGQKLLDEGDLTAARSFFRRVAESGDPRGALAMGATYDSNYWGELGIRTAQPDNTVAGEWYRRAMELGSKDAMDRLERLEK